MGNKPLGKRNRSNEKKEEEEMKLLTPHEKVALLRLIEKLPTTTPCMACQNYNAGWCKLCNDKIPNDVKDAGCESWVFAANSPPF
jgi:hypothetical protein